MPIYGNMVGAYSQMGKTFILEDENSNEMTGVVTDKEARKLGVGGEVLAFVW